MKRVLILSDTHYPYSNINKVLYDLIERCDLIIHCGDLQDNDFLEELESFGRKVYAVKGNNFDYLLDRKLPNRVVVDINGVIIGVCHGHGPYGKAILNAKKTFKDEKVDIVCYGHSHVLKVEDIEGRLFINPGSFSRSRAGKNSCIILNISDDKEKDYSPIYF